MRFFRLHINAIVQVIILNLGVLSILSCILSYTKFTVGGGYIVFSLTLCTLLYAISCVNEQTKRLLCYILFAAAAFYFIYHYRELFYPSLLYTANSFIEVLRQPYHMNILSFKLPSTDYIINEEPVIALLIIFLAAVLNILIKNAKSCIIILIITPMCLFGLYFNVVPDSCSLTALVAFWLAVFIYSGRQMGTKTASNAAAVLVIAFMAGGLVMAAIPKSGYEHPQFMQYIPQSIKDFLDDHLSPSGRATSMDDIRHGINGQGHLGDMDRLTQTGRKIMQVQTSLQAEDRLYLRNYSGAGYKDNSWNDLPDSVYKQYDKLFSAYSPGAWYDQSAIIFEALKNDERGQNTLMTYLKSDKTYNELFSARQFKVEKMFADQEQYFFPYNMDISSTAFSYDKAAQEEGIKTYHAAAYDMPPELAGVDAFIDNYGKNSKDILYYSYAEKMYREFVYKYYRQVPEGVLDQFSQKFPITQVRSAEDREQFIARLQQYFQENYKYTISPGEVPAGKDFVSYFLNESHEGYCTYFASAAVLILRQAGIPARYVVGYAVPEQTVATGEISGNDDSGKPIHDITIIDKQAHAWAEIYEDGWGWRPVDFTPGFMPQVKNKNNGQDKNNSQNTDKPEQQNQNNQAENKPKPDKPENKITPPVQNDENSLPQSHMPVVILFAAAAIGTALLWRRKCHKLLSNRFLNDITMQNQSERTSELYIYMEKLAKYLGIERPKHMDYVDYAKYLQQNEACWRDIPIEKFVAAVLKARFGSNEVLNKNETENTLAIIKKMRHNIYDKLNFMQRILFVYIYRL